MSVNAWGAVNTWVSGGTLSVVETVQSIDWLAQDPVIDFTGTIIIEESTQVINWATQDPIILFSGTIAVTESTQTINMLTQSPIIGFGTLWSDKPAATTTWTNKS